MPMAEVSEQHAAADRGDNAPGSGTKPSALSRRIDRFQRRRLLANVSIQSKLVVMLVLCTIVAATVVGIIAFQAGRTSLRDSAFTRLTEVRQSQSRALQEQLNDLKNSMIIYARGGATTRSALADFTAGFDALENKPLSPAQAQSLTDYYTNTYLTQVQQASGGVKLDADQLIPQDTAQRYLQANYTALRQNDDTAVKMDDAHDGSPWSAANARYQDFFREIVTRFEFEDAMLLDTRGNMVYTAYKDVDLAPTS